MAQPSIALFNTLTMQKEPLVPLEPGVVRVYVCGPTVYSYIHVGNARTFTSFDVIVRYLRYRGYRVTYVRNYTDVDDKIIKAAHETGEEPVALAARFVEIFREDARALHLLEPDVSPKVSDHIPEILRIIQALVDKGVAYESQGDVYFSVKRYPDYAKLSKRNLDDLCAGDRVQQSEHKHEPLDFALWKAAKPGEPSWDSPWGKGRPGWHIECSAMSERYLGYGFDVHCGGMDLVFPHHENEIAQSEAAHPGEGPFCSLWIHNGFVNVDKEKMAKSLGNFVTIRDVYQRNDPEALRYFLLTVHYRGPIAFETEKREDGRVIFPGILEAERRVDYLYHTLGRLGSLAELAGGAGTDGDGAPAPTMRLPREMAPMMDLASQARGKVDQALDDDLNTPVALAIVGELARAGNELVDLAQKRRKDAEVAKAAPLVAKMLARALWSSVEPLGILQTPMDVYRTRTQAQRLSIMGKTSEEIAARLEERRQARQEKDFARGDAIRKELEALGIEVADNPTGTTWRLGV